MVLMTEMARATAAPKTRRRAAMAPASYALELLVSEAKRELKRLM